MRVKFASFVQIVGLVSIAFAGFLIAPFAGFAVAGVAAVVIGVALERE